MYNEMKATVNGINSYGEEFTEPIHFKLLPPNKGERFYGTGYYMRVELPSSTVLVDVRYSKTTDIEILADQWIDGYFGKNAIDVVKQFPMSERELVPIPGAERLADLKAELEAQRKTPTKNDDMCR